MLEDEHDSVFFNIESTGSVSCAARPLHFSKKKGKTVKQAQQAGSMAVRGLKIGENTPQSPIDIKDDTFQRRRFRGITLTGIEWCKSLRWPTSLCHCPDGEVSICSTWSVCSDWNLRRK